MIFNGNYIFWSRNNFSIVALDMYRDNLAMKFDKCFKMENIFEISR